MCNSYNNLSNYLSNKLYIESSVNEGIFDKLFGSNTGKGKTFFGFIGSIFSSLSGEDDNISKAFKEIEETELANAKKREQDLANSAEGALIAKLRADSAQRENQLKLANDQKIAAYNATKRQLDGEMKFWKSNTRSFTAEQLEAANRKREEIYNGLGSVGGSDLAELNQLATILTTDEDGNTLSAEDIQKRISENSDLKDKADRFNKLAKKYRKPILDSINSKEFQEAYKQVPVYANEYDAAKQEMEEAESKVKDYEKLANVVTEYKEQEKKHKEASEKHQVAKDALSTFKDDGSGEDSYYTVNTDGDDLKITINDDNISKALKPGAITSKKDFEEYINSLKDKGIPESVIEKIKNEVGEDINKVESGKINSIIKNLDDDDKKILRMV